MCGICGVIGSERAELAESRVRAMLPAMAHRGPDDEGLLIAPRAVLGMRRLSIIDLDGGHQPVFNEDRTVGVVFNGEIYNFLELRSSLEACGHRFASRSDTEVIVHGYEEWGERCVERLRGMFAFALWDGRGVTSQSGVSLENTRQNSGRIFLARDRLGIKPLYYAHAEGTLLFASEVRTLLASGAIARRLAPEALHAYLLFGSVVEPMTLVDGIFSLLPGHSMLVSCEAPLEAKPRAYWDVATAAAGNAEGNLSKTLSSAGRAIRPLLDDAVHSHLISDVPLGLFLSSGLDSTALAVLASRKGRGLHTFTVAFEEREFSEAPLARRIAEGLGTEHRELLLTSDEMQRHMAEAVGALDQPSMDGINTFFVSWAARQVGLKVALSGLGGDEVFGGYPTFRSTPRLARLAAVARLLPAELRGALANSLLSLSDHGSDPRRSDILRKTAAAFGDPEALPHPYFYARMLFAPRQIDKLLSASGRAALDKTSNGQGSGALWGVWLEDTVKKAAQMEGDAAISCLELRTYMLDTLLRDTDAMSMHHSLEVRVPLLDHPLVESVLALPDQAKNRSGTNKALLVEALGADLPSEVLHKPKRTFTLPWERWLHGPLGSQVGDRLADLSPSLAAVLDPGAVQGVWQSFLLGRTGWARPWSLFALDAWVRRHLDEAEMAGRDNGSLATSLSKLSGAALS